MVQIVQISKAWGRLNSSRSDDGGGLRGRHRRLSPTDDHEETDDTPAESGSWLGSMRGSRSPTPPETSGNTTVRTIGSV